MKLFRASAPLTALLSCLFFTSNAHAMDFFGNINEAIPSSWFAGVGLATGKANITGNNPQYAASGIPDFPDDMYVFTSSHNPTLTAFSLLGGYQWQRNTDWLPAYSLALNYVNSLSSIKKSGIIYQNSLPDSGNFTFNYKISTQLLMLKFKADIYRFSQFMPFVSVGAGMAFNKASDYSTSPIPGQTAMVQEDGFASRTTTQFAKSIGAGIDWAISNKLQATLDYEYTTYGNVETGTGATALANNHLTQKLTSNTVGLQLAYFF